MQQMIERVHLTVAGVSHSLAPTESAEEVKHAIVQAVRAGGDFVEVTVDGGQRLSFLVTANVSVLVAVDTVTLSTETADRDARGSCPDALMVDEDDYPYDFL